MSSIHTFIRLLRNRNHYGIKRAIGIKFGKSKLSRLFPDEIYLRIQYRLFIGKKLDLVCPKTFNEKLQWLKLNDHNDEYIEMVDKYLAKKYVAGKIGEEYIIPTYGAWRSFDQIDFDKLPNQFVLKCNHDSGSIAICRDKDTFDRKAAESKLMKGLRTDGYYWGREWPYTKVKRLIIAEKYLQDSENEDIPDYKVHCFNGKAKFILVCRDRFKENGLTEDFFDPEWNRIDVSRPTHTRSSVITERPEWINEMISLAETLSKDFPFIRVDFYVVNNHIYFGELTLYPASGLERFVPDDYDLEFGNWIILDNFRR